MKCIFIVTILIYGFDSISQRDIYKDPFRQLDQQLPLPMTIAMPAEHRVIKYWQQQADYSIQLELNDDKQDHLPPGSHHVQNNSPDVLSFIWLQLDKKSNG